MGVLGDYYMPRNKSSLFHRNILYSRWELGVDSTSSVIINFTENTITPQTAQIYRRHWELFRSCVHGVTKALASKKIHTMKRIAWKLDCIIKVPRHFIRERSTLQKILVKKVKPWRLELWIHCLDLLKITGFPPQPSNDRVMLSISVKISRWSISVTGAVTDLSFVHKNMVTYM